MQSFQGTVAWPDSIVCLTVTKAKQGCIDQISTTPCRLAIFLIAYRVASRFVGIEKATFVIGMNGGESATTINIDHLFLIVLLISTSDPGVAQ
jgi:hypothetical protein